MFLERASPPSSSFSFSGSSSVLASTSSTTGPSLSSSCGSGLKASMLPDVSSSSLGKTAPGSGSSKCVVMEFNGNENVPVMHLRVRFVVPRPQDALHAVNIMAN